MRIVREVRFLPTPQDGNILISIICRPFYYVKFFPAETCREVWRKFPDLVSVLSYLF